MIVYTGGGPSGMQIEGSVVVYNPWWSGGAGEQAPIRVERDRHQRRTPLRLTRVAAFLAMALKGVTGGGGAR